MASKKTEPEVTEGMDIINEAPTNDPVDDGSVVVKLMKDGYRYRDDVLIGVNGHNILIKRGVAVRIPKPFYEVLKNSMDQDAETAILIDEKQAEYQQAVNANIM